MIIVQAIGRNFGDFQAVDDVSFQIRRGEIVGLLGHNGAGKSTILRMLTGYLEPSRGGIFIDGHEFSSAPWQVLRRIGYLPENCPVYPEMSVVDFLEYTASMRNLPMADRPQAVRTAIEQTELEDKATALISTLSRGYRQRVGVAQALLHQPDILILDEPTNGLDPGQIEHMRGLIKQLGQKSTVIISTHILQEVEAVCDRVLILRHGRLALDAELNDLRGRGLLLCCDTEPQKAYPVLQSLVHVRDVDLQEKTDGRFTYRLEPTDDAEALAPYVAERVVSAGWQLFALSHEEKSLERIFHQITAGEVSQDAA